MKYTVTVNGKKYEVEVEREEGGKKLLTRSSAAAPAPVAPAPVAAAPAPAPVKEAAPAPAPAKEAAPEPAAVEVSGGNTVVSPLPGSVFDVKVSAGEAVKFGQVLIVIEAMKMETEIVAPADGVVASVLVKKGDAVETDAPLVVLK
ncbi:MAG: acetyl-CoA carboxylase biotin carboxyl carrier protein subunit [Fusobacteriaceae bacterium]|jgi:pyruvate dehydrogenase E2 component (dihydrolipoamide acetyltransferase)|nr:acetyl-CoA carboxylase biotin carboxyl carrier protein subunit [Fusobacteriaceae bacterium]